MKRLACPSSYASSGRAHPDFTKKLKWQEVFNMGAKMMGRQVRKVWIPLMQHWLQGSSRTPCMSWNLPFLTPHTSLLTPHSSQLRDNLIHLPGSLVIEYHTAYRMHVVYIGQAIKVWICMFSVNQWRWPFQGFLDHLLFLRNMPDPDSHSATP